MPFDHLQDQVSGYRIESVLGEGGSATVYRATHDTLGSTHAIKVVAVPDQSMRERLLREGRAQGSLRHPNLVAVTEVIELDLGPALVLEFIDGPTLDLWLRDNRPTEDEALALFRSVVSGVAAAHKAGVTHRDLKPANILMAHSAGQWIPKTADFGLATIGGTIEPMSRGSMTDMNLLPTGTPAYMSPEQVRQERTGPAADVWALGCVLYELVCGRRAFEGDDPLELFNAILLGSYPDPNESLPGISNRTRGLIRRLLNTSLDTRPADAAEVLELLDGRVARRTQAPSLPPGPWLDPQPKRRAIPLPAAFGAAALLGLFGVVAGMLFTADSSGQAPRVPGSVIIEGAEILPEPAPPAPPALATPPPATVPAKPAPTKPAPARPAPARPAPAATAPEPAPAPVPDPAQANEPTTGTVRVTGDATSVALLTSGARLLPGELPAGSYAVEATFGALRVDAGTIQLAPEQTVNVQCSSFTASCVID